MSVGLPVPADKLAVVVEAANSAILPPILHPRLMGTDDPNPSVIPEKVSPGSVDEHILKQLSSVPPQLVAALLAVAQQWTSGGVSVPAAGVSVKLDEPIHSSSFPILGPSSPLSSPACPTGGLSPCTPPALLPAVPVDTSTRDKRIKEAMQKMEYDGEDKNAFTKQCGIKYRPRIAAFEQVFECAAKPCPAKRILLLYVAGERSEWIEKGAHSGHALNPSKRASAVIREAARSALELGAKPSVVLESLKRRAIDPANPSAELPADKIMTKKQLTNAKSYMALKQQGSARDLMSVCEHNPLLHSVMLNPLRIPIFLPNFARLIVSGASQFYIDSTFKLLVGKLLLTPLLVALPAIESSTRSTAGPVIPVGFYIHQCERAEDYEHFLQVVKKVCAEEGEWKPQVFHRDFCDKIAKAIKNVRPTGCWVHPSHVCFEQVWNNDVQQFGDSWHLLHAVARWLQSHGVEQSTRLDALGDVNRLLRTATNAAFLAEVDGFKKKWDVVVPRFMEYFHKEWLTDNKYVQWALFARPAGIDTGDHKGEAYNHYLKHVPFNGLRGVDLSKAISILTDELHGALAMISTPRLLEDRYRRFEWSQRQHDLKRLQLIDDEAAMGATAAAVTVPAQSPPPAAAASSFSSFGLGPASPPPLDTSGVPSDIMERIDALVAGLPDTISVAPSSPAQLTMEHLSPPPPLPSAFVAPPVQATKKKRASAVGIAIVGKSSGTCAICLGEKANATCSLRVCLSCCMKDTEHCTVSLHAAAKAKLHRSDLIAQVQGLLGGGGAKAVYISYKDNSGYNQCRAIEIVAWRSEPYSIQAICRRDPTHPVLKTFLLIRILRMELHPWQD